MTQPTLAPWPYVQTGHVLVRIHLLRDRYHEAEKELIQIAGGSGNGPIHQGSWSDLTWDFIRREDADLFVANARNVPGVVTVEIS